MPTPDQIAYDLNRQYLDARYELCRLICGPFRQWLIRRRNPAGPGCTSAEPEANSRTCELEIAEASRLVREIAAAAEATNCPIPFERLCREHSLDEDERTILFLLFAARMHGWGPDGLDLLKSLPCPNGNPLAKAVLLGPEGRLRKAGFVVRSMSDFLLLGDDYRITGKAFWPIAGVEGWEKLEESPFPPHSDEPRLTSDLEAREPRMTFDRLVLPDRVREQVEEIVWRCTSGTDAWRDYRLEKTITYGRGTIILFYGPPGTGKTAAAEATAARLGRKLAVARYDRLHDRYVGESEKKIARIFESARENDCVLLFDEADAFFGRRIEEHNSTDRYANGMTNLLMQQVENYTGIVILTTNYRTGMDEAFERRLSFKVEFPEPNAYQRAEIWKRLLADCPRVSPDVSYSELGARYVMAGGKIKNAVQRAVTAAARQNSAVTMAMLERAAEGEVGKTETMRKVGF